jgi:hypothetical protein
MARDERSDPSSADDGSGHDRNLLGLSGINVRTTCGAYPVLYSPDEVVPIGGAKVTRSSNSDQVTLIGAGVTVQKLPGRGRPAGQRRDRSGSSICTRCETH